MFVLCKKRAAFTLAETLIVLVILGVVAAITVPALVRNQMEAQNRTRLRKAMTVYDMAINKMVVENNFKSNTALTDWGNGNNCVNTKPYFKSVQDGNNNCRFRTSDGIWWDITDITRPKIDLRNDDFSNPSTIFQMFAHFGKDGELRVDDIQYDIANVQTDKYIKQSDVDNLTTLYNFANNKKEDTKSLFEECKEKGKTSCEIEGVQYILKTNLTGQCIDYPEGKSCGSTGDYWITENPVTISLYGMDAAKIDENCTEYCEYNYYDAAKNYCKKQGSNMATLGELKTLGYTGTDDYSGFWANEESNNEGYYIDYDGTIATSIKNYYSYNFNVVCVGK